LPALQDLRRAADHAAQRVFDHNRADAGGGLDPPGQAGQQRTAARQPDLAADDVLGQAGRDLRQHLVHGRRDRGDDRLERGRHQPARHVVRAGGTVGGVQADRLGPALGSAGHPERRLELPGGPLADDQPEFAPHGRHYRVVHRIAGLAQRSRPNHAPARDRRDLGGPAADVDHEAARAAGQVESRAGRRGHRLVDQPHVVLGAPHVQRGDNGPALDRGGAAWHADQRVWPQHAEPPGLLQERVQHRRGGLQVGYDPVPQRVDHLDVLRFLVGQRVCGSADRGDLPDGGVDGDRGRLLEHDAAPGHPDERVDRAEVDRHATAEAHVAPLCPTWRPSIPISGQADPTT
jgi:hypothetical protein